MNETVYRYETQLLIMQEPESQSSQYRKSRLDSALILLLPANKKARNYCEPS